jgi:drug/metabolite transporter (DMT)-like permease
MAALFLGEPILPTQVVGGAVIVLGVLVARREWRPIRRRAPVGG